MIVSGPSVGDFPARYIYTLWSALFNKSQIKTARSGMDTYGNWVGEEKKRRLLVATKEAGLHLNNV